MKVVTFRVDRTFCGDCLFGLKRFIQGIDGVASVDIAAQAISIAFDETVMKEDTLKKVARDSMERIGYRVEE